LIPLVSDHSLRVLPRWRPSSSEVDFNNLDERRHFGEFYEQLLNDLQSAGNAGEYYTPRAVTAFMADRIDPHPGEILFDPACGTGGFLTCAIRHMETNYVKTPKQRERMQGALRAVEKKQLPHMLCVTNMLLHGIEDPSFVRHDNTLARPLISWGKDERVDTVLTNPPFGGREEDGIENNFPTFRTKETADLFLALIVRLLKQDGRAGVWAVSDAQHDTLESWIDGAEQAARMLAADDAQETLRHLSAVRKLYP
jgi:type I restriction enzyme M protein